MRGWGEGGGGGGGDERTSARARKSGLITERFITPQHTKSMWPCSQSCINRVAVHAFVTLPAGNNAAVVRLFVAEGGCVRSNTPAAAVYYNNNRGKDEPCGRKKEVCQMCVFSAIPLQNSNTHTRCNLGRLGAPCTTHG